MVLLLLLLLCNPKYHFSDMHHEIYTILSVETDWYIPPYYNVSSSLHVQYKFLRCVQSFDILQRCIVYALLRV